MVDQKKTAPTEAEGGGSKKEKRKPNTTINISRNNGKSKHDKYQSLEDGVKITNVDFLLEYVIKEYEKLSEEFPKIDLKTVKKHGKNAVHFSYDQERSMIVRMEDGNIVSEDATLPEFLEDLFNYTVPERLSLLLFNSVKTAWYHYFFLNVDAAPQAIAALVFVKLKTEHGLIRSGSTIWAYYWAPVYCYRPIADLTRPNAPLAQLPFLQLENDFIRYFGSDFLYFDEHGKKHVRHYSRGKARDISLHFFQYCEINLSDDRAFLFQKPEPTISCANGIIDLRTGKMIEHKPDLKMTIPAFPYDFTGSVSVESEKKFERYFANLAQDEEEDDFLRWLPWVIGYTLTPWRLKIVLIFVGPNDSGKTTFLEMIERLHRASNTSKKVNFSRMANRPGDFDFEAFEETLAVIHDDFQPGGLLPAEQLKEIANKNTTITINKKFKAPYSRINMAAPIIGANADPKAKDPYIANRIVGTTFSRSFSQSVENTSFIEEIEALESELFNIGVTAMIHFFRNGADFQMMLPKSVKETSSRIVEGLNDATDWVSEMIEEERLYAGPNFAISKSQLYAMYSESRGAKALGRNSFYSAVGKSYKDHKSHGARVFLGIGRAIDLKGDEVGEENLPF